MRSAWGATSPIPRRASPRRPSSRARLAGDVRQPGRADRLHGRRRFASPRTAGTARVGIENRSKVGWELDPGATPDGSFGLQLFETGDAKELEHRNKSGTLPAVRRGHPLPTRARCRSSSRRRRGRGASPRRGRSWPAVGHASSFGTLIAVGKPPEGLGEVVVWITDQRVPAAAPDGSVRRAGRVKTTCVSASRPAARGNGRSVDPGGDGRVLPAVSAPKARPVAVSLRRVGDPRLRRSPRPLAPRARPPVPPAGTPSALGSARGRSPGERSGDHVRRGVGHEAAEVDAGR